MHKQKRVRTIWNLGSFNKDHDFYTKEALFQTHSIVPLNFLFFFETTTSTQFSETPVPWCDMMTWSRLRDLFSSCVPFYHRW